MIGLGKSANIANKTSVTTINDLNSTWQGLSEKMYQKTKDAEASQHSASNQDQNPIDKKDKDNEVEEADFEEVK